MATFPEYQIYVELEDFEPKMWRRFIVLNDITLARLGYILMSIFEIRNGFSYEFRKDELNCYLIRHPEYARHPERLEQLNKTFIKERYGITSKKNVFMYRKPDGYEKLEDSTKTKMKDVLQYPNDEVTFIYDPEVNWKFRIKLEKITHDKKLYAKELPKVIDGQEYGIIETCGGTKDLEEFRKKLKNDRWWNHSDYKYYSLNKEQRTFHFDKIDLEDMNFRLKSIPRSFQQLYEENLYHSFRTIKLLKRHYNLYRKSENNQ